jgi:hypothetical protein
VNLGKIHQTIGRAYSPRVASILSIGWVPIVLAVPAVVGCSLLRRTRKAQLVPLFFGAGLLILMLAPALAAVLRDARAIQWFWGGYYVAAAGLCAIALGGLLQIMGGVQGWKLGDRAVARVRNMWILKCFGWGTGETVSAAGIALASIGNSVQWWSSAPRNFLIFGQARMHAVCWCLMAFALAALFLPRRHEAGKLVTRFFGCRSTSLMLVAAALALIALGNAMKLSCNAGAFVGPGAGGTFMLLGSGVIIVGATFIRRTPERLAKSDTL